MATPQDIHDARICDAILRDRWGASYAVLTQRLRATNDARIRNGLRFMREAAQHCKISLDEYAARACLIAGSEMVKRGGVYALFNRTLKDRVRAGEHEDYYLSEDDTDRTVQAHHGPAQPYGAVQPTQVMHDIMRIRGEHRSRVKNLRQVLVSQDTKLSSTRVLLDVVFDMHPEIAPVLVVDIPDVVVRLRDVESMMDLNEPILRSSRGPVSVAWAQDQHRILRTGTAGFLSLLARKEPGRWWITQTRPLGGYFAAFVDRIGQYDKTRKGNAQWKSRRRKQRRASMKR